MSKQKKKTDLQFKRNYYKRIDQIKSEYPRFRPIKETSINIQRLKNRFGGDLPNIRGRKYKYPSSTDEDAWKFLYANCLNYKKYTRICIYYSKKPYDRDYLCEYLLYHATKKQIKRRAIRNSHRRRLGLKVNDPRQVHHEDQTDLKFSKAVILTPCEHKKLHGHKCHAKDAKGLKRLKRNTPAQVTKKATTKPKKTIKPKTKRTIKPKPKPKRTVKQKTKTRAKKKSKKKIWPYVY